MISASVGGIWAQNNSTGYEDAYAPITINADTIRITAGEMGVVAMSQGTVTLNGNTYIKAPDVVLTRGGSITTINKDGNHTVCLDGDINFNYDQATSGTSVDAIVDVTLSGTESYWIGNSKYSYTSATSVPESDKLISTGLSVKLANGAQWNATEVKTVDEYDPDNKNYKYSGSGLSKVNTLTLVDGGVVNAGTALVSIGNLTIQGQGNKGCSD